MDHRVSFWQAYKRAAKGFAQAIAFVAIIALVVGGEAVLIWHGWWWWLVPYSAVIALGLIALWARDIQRFSQ